MNRLLLSVLMLTIISACASCSHNDQDASRNEARDIPEISTTRVSQCNSSAIEDVIVCLDPGHPSEVSDGNVVQNGTTETHINWIIVSELKEVLEENGLKVIMTKSSENEFVSNETRADIANNARACLLLRIHCDTSTASARGITFYYPDRQGTWNGLSGPPSDILAESRKAATVIHDTTIEELGGLLVNRGVMTDNDTYVGHNQGGALRASIFSKVPVVVVEVCFLSNPEDAAIVVNPETRARVIDAMADGIERYLSCN